MIPAAIFVLAMFILEADVNFQFELVAAGGEPRRGRAAVNSIYRSILARSLMTGAASLAFVLMAPAMVRAETVIVQGDDGAAGADGVNPGDDGMPGGDGESVGADAGSVHPITAPLNTSTATGGNGGPGGQGGNLEENGFLAGSGGKGGKGGTATATAATTIISGSA